MSSYLLDTHTLLWYLENNNRLTEKVKVLLEDTNNQLFISIASIWEIAIKMNIGKLTMLKPFENLENDLQMLDIKILPINFAHTQKYLSLELPHRDPFDRILVVQCQEENLIFISADEIFDSYPIQRIF